MRRVVLRSLAAVAVLSLLATDTLGGDYATGASYTGFRIGLVGSGAVDIDGGDADFNRGLTGGLFFDLPLGSRFHYGLSADYVAMAWKSGIDTLRFESSEYLIDLGVNLKMSLTGKDSPLALRPGIGLGFGLLPEVEGAGLASSTYTTLKAFFELDYFGGGDIALVFDGGVWYAPSGGDNDTDVKIGPVLFLRGGLMF